MVRCLLLYRQCLKLINVSRYPVKQDRRDEYIVFCGIFFCRLYRSSSPRPRLRTNVPVYQRGAVARNDSKSAVIFL